MPEGEEHAAGSWLGDLTNEWKHAKPPEKAFIVIAVLAVGGIGYYVYTQNKNAGTSTTNAPGQNTGTSGGGGQTSGFPTIPQGQTPVLPPGISPIYDANGNVIAYGPSGTPSAPGATGTQAPPTTTPPTDTGNLSSGIVTQYINPPSGMNGNVPTIKTAQTKIAPRQSTHVATTRARQATTCPAGQHMSGGKCVPNTPAPAPVGSNQQTTASKLKVAQQGKTPAGGPH